MLNSLWCFVYYVGFCVCSFVVCFGYCVVVVCLCLFFDYNLFICGVYVPPRSGRTPFLYGVVGVVCLCWPFFKLCFVVLVSCVVVVCVLHVMLLMCLMFCCVA